MAAHRFDRLENVHFAVLDDLLDARVRRAVDAAPAAPVPVKRRYFASPQAHLLCTFIQLICNWFRSIPISTHAPA